MRIRKLEWNVDTLSLMRERALVINDFILYPNSVYIISGASGQGKTSFALRVAVEFLKDKHAGVYYVSTGDMNQEKLTLYLASVIKTLEGSSYKDVALAIVERRTELPPQPKNFFYVQAKADELTDLIEHIKNKHTRGLVIVDYLQGLGDWRVQARTIASWRAILNEEAGIVAELEPKEPIGNMIYTLFISQIKKRDTSSNKAIRDELFAMLDDMSGSKELINMADYVLASIGQTRVRVPSLPLLKVLKSRLPDVASGRYLDFELKDITFEVEKGIEEFFER